MAIEVATGVSLVLVALFSRFFPKTVLYFPIIRRRGDGLHDRLVVLLVSISIAVCSSWGQ